MSEEKIADLDKRLAVLANEVSTLQGIIKDMKSGQTRLFLVVAGSIAGYIVQFAMSGGFNVGN